MQAHILPLTSICFFCANDKTFPILKNPLPVSTASPMQKCKDNKKRNAAKITGFNSVPLWFVLLFFTPAYASAAFALSQRAVKASGS